MMHRATILIFSLFFIININYAAALTCKSGTSSACSSSRATDCVTLGYHAANIPNCKHYLRCPFNIHYSICVAFNDDVAPDCSDYPLTACPENGICQNCPDDATYKKFTGCKSGYQKTSDGTKCELSTCAAGYAKSVDGCGDTGANGWTLGPKDADGCGKCTENACSGDANLTSVDSCGSSGDKGWNYTSCYYGDELRGTCTAKTCSDHGLESKKGEVYQEFDVYLGDSLRVCYENSRCEDNCDNCYSRRISCYTWCQDYVPTEVGRYLINEPLYFDDGKRVGNCYTGHPASPTEYNTHDNTCCCAGGEVDPSYCIMGGQGF